MSKKFIYAIMAAVALLAVSCDKDDKDNENEQEQQIKDEKVTKADLIGSWGMDETPTFVFKEDGTYTESRWEENISGQWTMSENKLSFTPNGGEAWDAGFMLIGGKAWLVLVYEDDDPEYKFRSFENFRKIGATVASGTLTDGRWDAPRDGFAPASYTKDASYTFCMLIKGTTIDLYVPMWGYHIQGSFTLSDGKMHIETDDDHIWFGAYMEQDGDYGSIGWNAWDTPSEDYRATWDDSYGSMNAETFELQSPYRYYTVNEIKAMGKKPDPNDNEYKTEPWKFKFMIYEWGENVHENCMDLCDFNLCVAPSGKEAFGGAIGLCPWIYKR